MQPRLFANSALALFSLLMLGCHSEVIVVNGIEVYADIWQSTVSEVGGRASFELDCPAEDLEFHLIRRQWSTPVEVGVVGCGRRGTYIKPPNTNGVAHPWVLQSTSADHAAVQLPASRDPLADVQDEDPVEVTPSGTATGSDETNSGSAGEPAES